MGWKADVHTATTMPTMSSLTTEAIAFRAVGLWVIGVFALAVLNAHSYLPSYRRRATRWLIIPGLLAKFAVLLGPVGLGLIVGRVTGQWNETLAMAAIAAAILIGYVASSVLVQVGRNVACAIIGAPVQPIHIWRQDKRPKRQKRRNL